MGRANFPRDVIELVTARSQGYCEVMSTGCTLMAEHHHHRRPKSMGGTRRPESQLASNCCVTCLRCHLKIHAMPSWARDNGFLVRQSDHPAMVPMWWRCAETGGHKDLVLLDDAGHTIPTALSELM